MALAAAMWNVFDGMCSILYYRGQSPREHLVRVIRIAFGFLLISVWYLAQGVVVERVVMISEFTDGLLKGFSLGCLLSAILLLIGFDRELKRLREESERGAKG